MSIERRYDIVLFGATGFTGTLTAEYLARHAPARTRWALAGRNAVKLDALRDRLASRASTFGEPSTICCDAADAASLDHLAASTRVVISTVGPYLDHGEQLVAACARTGTDYLDITGESEFVDLVYLRYHARAVRSGARIVHSCGFDSLPYDLGAYFTVEHLRGNSPVHLEAMLTLDHDRTTGVRDRFSSGSLRSALLMTSRRRQRRSAASARRMREAHSTTRRSHASLGAPRFERYAGRWLVPVLTIDSEVVCRSAVALERYGPDLLFRQYVAFDRPSAAARFVGGACLLFASAQITPVRHALLERISEGAGPAEAQRARRWFNLRLTAEAGGRRVVSEVSGGDPGYGETSKMLAESALCLAHDNLPPHAGQLTSAVAMGDALIARLRRRGISFSLLAVEQMGTQGESVA